MITDAAAELGEELTAEVDAMIRDSKVIPAVKMVRDKLGWDLLSAKDAVFARRAVLGRNPSMELARGADLDKFKEFFKKMGVRQSLMKMSDHEGRPDERGAVMAISVTQAHFCFDEHGCYIGVLADEMGDFDERMP